MENAEEDPLQLIQRYFAAFSDVNKLEVKGMHGIPNITDAEEQSEALAMRLAVELAHSNGWTDIMTASGVVNKLNSSTTDLSAIEETKQLLQHFPFSSQADSLDA
ncbi:hypothetical protein Salat_1142300 [Sesamum alatum]|uniref:Uncharacterized protein n=1 Tax=Sesamum alatum TaxID=300844 RepID=A0AAE1YE86_9LAMI|nr:hypothetical protein Salat_1142300 [Sesamum alatum]